MKKSIAIIGGGAAAMSVAAHLDSTLFDVSIYEQSKTIGRKFLVAGVGGFNLTYSEPMEQLSKRFYPVSFLDKALQSHTNDHLVTWLESIGIACFVGSSKRVFPVKELKPIDVLNKIVEELERKNVSIKTEHTWTGWNAKGQLTFDERKALKADHIIFALGGASWKVTGSDGKWTKAFKENGIKTVVFKPANCAYKIEWSKDFLSHHEGKPLKNIAIRCNNVRAKGEVVITKFGLEGNALYPHTIAIQEQLKKDKKAVINLDLKPSLSYPEIREKITSSQKSNISTTLSKVLKLSRAEIALLKNHLSKDDFQDIKTLSKTIKSLDITLLKAAPKDQAISTTGGVDILGLSPFYEIEKLKNNYCIGEMVDWYAPTGGYLLQACFSMGYYLAEHLNGAD